MKEMLSTVVLVVLLTASGFAQSSRLTNENWLTHTDIVDTRAVYKEIRELIDGHHLQFYERIVAAMGEYTHNKSAYVDKELRIRFLNIRQSDEGGSYNAEIYYDSLHRLRFIYIKQEIYNNEEDALSKEIEYRIYYPIDPEPYRIPMWVVKSLNGKQVEMGTEVNITQVVEDLDLRNPYAEFHDAY